VRRSARQSLVISSHIAFSFANLPSGNATWHNLYLALFVCRDQSDDQNEVQVHHAQAFPEDYFVV
jgi:hypothetical protein